MIKEGIIKAYEYAQKMHEGQIRKFSNLPYFSHPKGVARIIEELTGDEILIIASLLHDIIEDTPATFHDLKELFGSEVALLVEELSSNKPEGQRKAEYLKMKMVAMTPRALTIKLADRFHNVKYLEGDNVNISFIKKYYKETREIIVFLKENVEFDKVQLLLVNRIDIILDFLQVRYDLA